MLTFTRKLIKQDAETNQESQTVTGSAIDFPVIFLVLLLELPLLTWVRNMCNVSQQSAGDEFKDKLENKDRQSKLFEDEEFNGVVQADFSLFDPKPDDFHGVKTLLLSYLDNK